MTKTIKEAFNKVKEEILFIKSDISLLKKELQETRQLMIKLSQIIKDLSVENNPAHPSNNPAHPSNNPAHFTIFKAQKGQNSIFSTGNQGVPTDRQTDRQTDQQTHLLNKNFQSKENFPIPSSKKEGSFIEILKTLDSLDEFKKEIRLKFKRLTEKEFLVFSTIYQLEEQGIQVEYSSLANRLNLTESSIRDYIGKLIKKNIPILKEKINNKNIFLKITPDFKKLIPLPTLITLRDL